MKILELCLRAFGPFTDFTLDFSGGGGPGGLHFIYGPNEAGKSTTRRAIFGLLYGIPMRSADDFLHDKQAMRLAARLRRADGAEYAFTRRKGSKNTLLDFAGAAPLPEDGALTRCLGGADEEFFKTLFCLDHAELVNGGANILEGRGAVGEALFSAGLGGANLRGVLQELDAEAETFFKKKGSNQLISSGLSQYREVRERLRAATFTGADWQKFDQQKTQANAQRQQLTAARDARRAERERLDRLAKAKPAFTRRRQLLEQLATLGALPPLPETFPADRAAAQADGRSAALEQEKRGRELEEIQAQSAKLKVRADVLECADAITALSQGVRHYRESAAALPGLRGELNQLESAATESVAELWPGQTPESSERLRLTAWQCEAIRRQAAAHATLSAAEAAAREALEEIDFTLAERRQELTALPPARDLAALDGAARRLLKRGDLSAALSSAQQEHSAAKAEAIRLLAVLPSPWQKRPDTPNGTDSSFAELTHLPVPLAESIARFEQEFSVLENRAAQLARDAEICARETTSAQRSLDALRQAGDVPTEADLEEARRQRRAHWQKVLLAWTNDGAAQPETVRQSLSAKLLLETYAQAVTNADGIADRLRREANRVAQRAELQASLDAGWQRRKTIEQQQLDAANALAALRVRWLESWRNCNLEPLPPAEMRSWLTRHEKLCTVIALARKNQQTVESAQTACEDARADLLTLLPDPFSGRSLRLDSLLELAQERVAAANQSNAQRDALTREIAVSETAQRPAAVRKLQAARDALDVWTRDWSAALAPLALERTISPEEAAEVLNRIAAFSERLKDTQRCREKIQRAEEHLAVFAQEIQVLLTRLQPDPALIKIAHDAVANQLFGQLEQARAARQTCDNLELRLRAAVAARAEATGRAAAAQRILENFCRLADCETPDKLDAVETRWKQAGDLRRSLVEVENQLFHLSAGQPMEALSAETDALDADTLPARLEALETEIKFLDEQIVQCAEEATRADVELQRFDKKADAIHAAEDAEQVLAKLREQSLQYARLRLAGAVLRREMERYRLENQNPLVRRAGELFAILTQGSFAGLCVDQDESDKAALRGVRPDQSGTTPVSGMSEGTCDQLYLALRLASLEKTLVAQEPLPLILDDILINADDGRAGAMLQVLRDFSRQTQVLLFTHHEHLLILAEQELGAGAFVTHRLPRRQRQQIAVNVGDIAKPSEEQLALG